MRIQKKIKYEQSTGRKFRNKYRSTHVQNHQGSESLLDLETNESDTAKNTITDMEDKIGTTTKKPT